MKEYDIFDQVLDEIFEETKHRIKEQHVMHAKWLGPEGKPVCSNCNVDIEKYYVNTAEDAEIWRVMNYCPRCGAKMDKP